MEILFQILGSFVVLVGLLVVGLLALGLRLFEVNEGTGTAFKFLGKYCYSVMSLNGFHFGLKEFIELDPGLNSTGKCWCLWRIGGWVFYIKWFVKPTKYTDQNDPDGFGENYSVFLNQIQREFTLKKAETGQDKTGKDESIPLDIRTAFKMKIVNIYLFLFIAPKDVIAQVIKIMEAVMLGWVNANSYNEIQGVKKNGKKMWDHFGSDIKDSIKKIRDDWGVEILEDSISIMDVGLQEEDQKAFAEKKRQKLRTAAAAQELLGGMLENEALAMGVEDGTAARDRLAPEKLESMVARANQVVTQRALGVKPNLFGNADGTPLEPITATIAALISLAKGTSSGASSGGESGESSTGSSPKGGEKKVKKTAEEMEPEELEAKMEKIRKEAEARKKKP